MGARNSTKWIVGFAYAITLQDEEQHALCWSDDRRVSPMYGLHF